MRMEGFSLPVYGRHNVLNALAAIGVGLRLGISEDNMKKALAAFTGVQRRFTKTGEANGVTIIDDYGHHPIEIASTLRAAREVAPKKVIAVFQPHRYTRVADLFEMFCTAFNDADCVIVADVYSAGEKEIPSANKEALAEGMRAHGHRHVIVLNKREDLADIIKNEASAGDIVVCLGAGSISSWAKALPQELTQAYENSNKGFRRRT